MARPNEGNHGVGQQLAVQEGTGGLREVPRLEIQVLQRSGREDAEAGRERQTEGQGFGSREAGHSRHQEKPEFVSI